MDRLPISASVPADLAERLSDVAGEEFSHADLREAREELVEKIMSGPRLWTVLQEWLNVGPAEHDKRLQILATQIQQLVNGAELDRADFNHHQRWRAAQFAEARFLANNWLDLLVRDYLTDKEVEDRAAEIAAERVDA